MLRVWVMEDVCDDVPETVGVRVHRVGLERTMTKFCPFAYPGPQPATSYYARTCEHETAAPKPAPQHGHTIGFETVEARGQ